MKNYRQSWMLKNGEFMFSRSEFPKELFSPTWSALDTCTNNTKWTKCVRVCMCVCVRKIVIKEIVIILKENRRHIGVVIGAQD